MKFILLFLLFLNLEASEITYQRGLASLELLKRDHADLYERLIEFSDLDLDEKLDYEDEGLYSPAFLYPSRCGGQ